MIKLVLFFIMSMINATAHGGMALDISTSIGWWDANDIDADNNETNNPAHNSPITHWHDKSNEGHHLTPHISTFPPVYQTNDQSMNSVLLNNSMLSTGLARPFNFVGSGGSIFAVARNPENTVQFEVLFSTRYGENGFMIYHQNQIFQSWIHTSLNTWNVAYLQSTSHLPASLNRSVIEHKINTDGRSRELSKQGVRSTPGILPHAYTVGGELSMFNIGGNSTDAAPFRASDMHINEVLVFKEFVTQSQSHLIVNYLSEKWGIALESNDFYQPPDSPSSDHRHHVGGFGRDTNGHFGQIRHISGVGGLYLKTNDTVGNGTFVMAGHNNKPATLDSERRMQRQWYIDQTGGQTPVNMTFKAPEIGDDVVNGDMYVLYYSPDGREDFSPVSNEQAFTNGALNITLTPKDGVYTLGRGPRPNLTIKKNAHAIYDPINGFTSAKVIPGSVVEYTIAVSNSGNGSADNNSIVINDVLGSKLHLIGNAYEGNDTVKLTDACPTPNPALPGQISQVRLDPSKIVYTDVDNSPVAAPTSINGTIRHIKIPIDGIMSGYSGSGNTPCFSVSYRCELQ